MTETSDSGNYSQYEEGSSENTSETFLQKSSNIINPYQMSDDDDDSDESDDSDYDDSENVKKVDTTSVYSWVIILICTTFIMIICVTLYNYP